MSTPNTDARSDACVRCGLADATCHVVLTPEFAHVLKVPETKFVDQRLCERCWHELFGHDPKYEEFVRRWVYIGPFQMDGAREMIEREEWE